jgi:outer membrane autotransporter protein
MQYLFLAQQGFTESGGPAALSVSSSQANSLRANIGARLAIDQFIGPNGAAWTPYTNLRLVSELLDNDRLVNASFSGAPIGGTFSTQGTSIGYVYGILGQGAQVRLNDRWSLFGGVDLMAGSRITTETGSLAAMYYW